MSSKSYIYFIVDYNRPGTQFCWICKLCPTKIQTKIWACGLHDALLSFHFNWILATKWRGGSAWWLGGSKLQTGVTTSPLKSPLLDTPYFISKPTWAARRKTQNERYLQLTNTLIFEPFCLLKCKGNRLRSIRVLSFSLLWALWSS